VFLARGVIITLTPLCNDDRKLIVLDKGTNNTCAEVERVVMVVINDIIVGDKIGACDVVIITNVNTTTTVVSCCQCCQCNWCCEYYRCANAIGALKVARVVGIVGGISITLETDIIIPEIIQGVKRLKSYGTKILCHTRNCL
jgi:hypothetical protein